MVKLKIVEERDHDRDTNANLARATKGLRTVSQTYIVVCPAQRAGRSTDERRPITLGR